MNPQDTDPLRAQGTDREPAAGVRVIVMPTGPKATPEAIETWKGAAQRAADEHGSEIELVSRNDDGSVAAHLIAYPGWHLAPRPWYRRLAAWVRRAGR